MTDTPPAITDVITDIDENNIPIITGDFDSIIPFIFPRLQKGGLSKALISVIR